MRLVTDEEQKILDCYADLARVEIMEFKKDIEKGRLSYDDAMTVLHGVMSVFIRFLTRGKENYANTMIRKFEALIERRLKQ